MKTSNTLNQAQKTSPVQTRNGRNINGGRSSAITARDDSSSRGNSFDKNKAKTPPHNLSNRMNSPVGNVPALNIQGNKSRQTPSNNPASHEPSPMDGKASRNMRNMATQPKNMYSRKTSPLS